MLHSVIENQKGTVELAKVDIDSNAELAMEYEVNLSLLVGVIHMPDSVYIDHFALSAGAIRKYGPCDIFFNTARKLCWLLTLL